MIQPDSAGVSIEKAERALGSCRTLVEHGDTVGACNRAYYAMFYAAHAALWAVDAHQTGAIIKTHGGLIAVFGQRLVVTNRVGIEHGRALARVHRTRLLADYSDEPPTDGEAEISLRLATAFVAAMRRIVEARMPPT